MGPYSFAVHDDGTITMRDTLPAVVHGHGDRVAPRRCDSDLHMGHRTVAETTKLAAGGSAAVGTQGPPRMTWSGSTSVVTGCTDHGVAGADLIATTAFLGNRSTPSARVPAVVRAADVPATSQRAAA